MACILKGSHSFTCTPRIHQLTEWTIPAFAFPAEASTHLPTLEGWKAELTFGGWLVTYRNKCPAPGIEPKHGRPSNHITIHITNRNHIIKEERLVVSICHQWHYCNRHYCPATRLQPSSSHVASGKLLSDRSSFMSCKSDVCECRQLQTMNNIIDIN